MIDLRSLRETYKSSTRRSRYKRIFQQTPEPMRPTVTQRDAENGFILRHFIRPVSDENYVMEIDKRQYSIFKKNPRFVTTVVEWRIVGKKESTFENGVENLGVRDINVHRVSLADLTFRGLSLYIVDYLEFWLAEA